VPATTRWCPRSCGLPYPPAVPARPTAAQLEAARDRRLRDVLRPGLAVVFCGINPSLYSAAVGHHFARPGNRFWQALHDAGFTDRLLAPDEDATLPRYGCGVTNLVPRATASADELGRDELAAGARRLLAKLRRVRPRCVAFLGVGAYRDAFGRRDVRVGPQPETLAGAQVWVLPNPSGRTAGYQRADFARLFAALRHAAFPPGAAGAPARCALSGRASPATGAGGPARAARAPGTRPPPAREGAPGRRPPRCRGGR
jgi:TDG/mug DNA glycosylase family protein